MLAYKPGSASIPQATRQPPSGQYTPTAIRPAVSGGQPQAVSSGQVGNAVRVGSQGYAPPKSQQPFAKQLGGMGAQDKKVNSLTVNWPPRKSAPPKQFTSPELPKVRSHVSINIPEHPKAGLRNITPTRQRVVQSSVEPIAPPGSGRQVPPGSARYVGGRLFVTPRPQQPDGPRSQSPRSPVRRSSRSPNPIQSQHQPRVPFLQLSLQERTPGSVSRMSTMSGSVATLLPEDQTRVVTVLDVYDNDPSEFLIHRENFIGKRPGIPQNDYWIIQEMGQGAFGIVYLIRPQRGGEDRICKCVDKRAAASGPDVTEEIKQLQQLDHPNIIRLLEYYEDFKNLYIILGTASGGDLEELLCSNPPPVPMTETLLAEVLRQTLEATSYCHAKKIIHKDLKPANIMFLTKDYENPQVCVVDFGLAELLQGQGQVGASGTPGFMAPEVWAAAVGQGQYGNKCDIFSIGAILFYCSSGARLPWTPADASGDSIQALAPSFLEAFRRREEEEFNGVFCGGHLARDLAMKMLSRDPWSRPSAQSCLQHPWLRAPSQQKRELDPQSLRALSNSTHNTKFQQRILIQAAAQIPTHAISHINAIFKALDKKGDGSVSYHELIVGMQGLGMNEETSQALAEALDTNGDGKIEYSEFLAGLIDRCSIQFQDALWAIFCRYDTDRSGYLNQAQLKLMLAEGGPEAGGLICSDKEAKSLLSLIKMLDADGDGQISYHELCDYLMSRPNEQDQQQSRFRPSNRNEEDLAADAQGELSESQPRRQCDPCAFQ